jgi:hypothetical protein
LAAVSTDGTLDLAAVGAMVPVVGQAPAALDAASDGGHPPLGGEPALGVELDHGAVAERLDLLGTTQADPLLSVEATCSQQLALV